MQLYYSCLLKVKTDSFPELLSIISYSVNSIGYLISTFNNIITHPPLQPSHGKVKAAKLFTYLKPNDQVDCSRTVLLDGELSSTVFTTFSKSMGKKLNKIQYWFCSVGPQAAIFFSIISLLYQSNFFSIVSFYSIWRVLLLKIYILEF